LLAIDPDGDAARPALDRLESHRQKSRGGKLAWWGPSGRTMFFGAGQSGAIETTAVAVLALLDGRRGPESVRGALAWLVAQKDGQGTWGSTQATVLALKTLLAGTGKPLGGDDPRRIAILLDGEIVQELVIPADQADVMQQVDLSARVANAPGTTRRLKIEDRTGTDSGYQVVFRYHEPDAVDVLDAGALRIRVDYDRTAIALDETVTATAAVTNDRPEPAPMVILDLPIPAGFAIDADDLAGLVESGSIAKFQLTARSAIVYLRDLKADAPLTLRYRLRATMPVKLTVPPARAYEYYDPSRQGSSPAVRLTVGGAKS
jgi:alpha-2-macroglobulin-like protein